MTARVSAHPGAEPGDQDVYEALHQLSKWRERKRKLEEFDFG